MLPGDFITYPPEVFTGFPTDEGLRNVFYGLMHGEDIWMENGKDAENWAEEFIRQFCLIQVPFFYLNRYRRERIEEHDNKINKSDPARIFHPSAGSFFLYQQPEVFRDCAF